jgi:nucleotide-binding universal stress UspA family protein
VLGPLAIPLAIAHREKVAVPPTGTGVGGGEPGRVLVGVRPGTTLDEIAPALRRLTALAGPVPLTLATVLDAEACERPTGATLVAEAEAFLDRVATALVEAGITTHPVERQVLFGDPASALAAFADGCDAALIAVGAGEPLARRAVHGSTRSRLLRHATVPVLCVPGHAVTYRGKEIPAALGRS